MTLDQAESRIAGCFEHMNARYGGVVFDEWAIISLADNKARVICYFGPRKEGFKANFSNDAAALRSGLLTRDHPIGDFEFARHGVGTGFESYMRIGVDSYLICNNTVQSMDAIARNPAWINAQVPFVDLSETFRQNALTP